MLTLAGCITEKSCFHLILIDAHSIFMVEYKRKGENNNDDDDGDDVAKDKLRT